jgi:N-methylhydantoinase A
MPIRLGIDVGGTFTDLFLLNEGQETAHLVKTPSTPNNHIVGILKGFQELLSEAGIAAGDIDSIVHATSLPTNVVLEGKGCRVGLLVTENFEQVLHLARSQTPGPFNGWMAMQKPDLPCNLELTRGVPERINARGEIISPMDETRARELIDEIVRKDVESITISLLHAYVNPQHELVLRDIVRSVYPDLPVFLSSETHSEIREYERTLVTVLNAYIQPPMTEYLRNLQQEFERMQCSPTFHMFRSDGGLMGTDHAITLPIYSTRSGPAGGVYGAAFESVHSGYSNVIGFDMGGTSTDISLIQEGRLNTSPGTLLGKFPIDIPAIQVHSIGAGGGSIAEVSVSGTLQIGPKSANAVPGPACHGKGGTAATVTDANLVLGRLPSELIGGKILLDTKLAEEAIGQLARRLELDLLETAQAVIDVANENIFGALRLAAAQKGSDLRNFALMAYGGAGPLHGNALATLGQCYPVIVPPTPGVLSAFGFLCANIRHEVTGALIGPLDVAVIDDIRTRTSELVGRMENWLSDEGVATEDQNLEYSIDIQYRQQNNPITLPLQPDNIGEATIKDLMAQFETGHEQCYGFKVDVPVEIVKLRVIGTATIDQPTIPNAPSQDSGSSVALVGERRVYIEGEYHNAPIYDRSSMSTGNEISGPAVVTQRDSTTLIHPNHLGRIDGRLNLLIETTS